MSNGLLNPKADTPINWVDPVNWLHPLNSGLAAWWLCVGGAMGGSRWQDLCRRNDGVLTNMEPQSDWQGANRSGAFGRLVLGGTDEYVSTGLSLASLPQFTISAWVRRNAAGSLIYLASTAASTYIQVGFFSDGTLYVTPDASGSVFMTTASNVATPLHLVYSFRGSAGTAAARNRVWLNGVEATMAGSVAATTTNSGAGTLDIGRRSSGGVYSVGDIDDVRVYRRAVGHDGQAVRLYLESLRGYPGALNRTPLPSWAPAGAAAATRANIIGSGIGGGAAYILGG